MAGPGTVGRLQLGDHVCALVDGFHGGLDLMTQTVAAGLAAGEQVMMFTAAPAAVLAGLQSRGVVAVPGGQVQVLSAGEAFLQGGRFDSLRMLDSLVRHIEQATAAGFAGLRLVGDMTWALDEPEQLVEYEARVNHLYLRGRALGVCLYDRRAFGSDMLRQVACAHPATVTPDAENDWVPQLRIRHTVDPYGLRLSGDADVSNRQALASALDAVVDRQPDPTVPIVLDLAGLVFADTATASLLGRLALRAPAGVHVRGARRTVEKILDRVGVTGLSSMYMTRARTEMVA